MMTVSAPPRPPRTPEPEALFEEARRYRRRRRLKLAAGVLAVIAAGIGAYAVLGSGTQQPSTVRVLTNGVLTPVPNQTVVLLVDVSGSMRALDVSPSRLEATTKAMEALIARLPGRFEVGLVTFDTTARVVQPPTRDRRRIRAALAELRPGAGTALGDGLAAAVTLTVSSLAQHGIRRAPGHPLPAVIVLESDGAQNRGAVTPRQAAAQAKAAGLRVDGVALGTPGGSVQFGFAASPTTIPVPPDPKTVASIAQLTGGESFTAPTASRLETIYRDLAASIAR